ncbi:hypothetical protein [Micromonospora sp. MA102]|uniref:hypothetical protein n=1 Tax=Micromonospora sp. MA102 TaxID=2952755 RepID=UPI0021CA0B7C|nr:hypothetical protein [Micromonospora sp. MA102]
MQQSEEHDVYSAVLENEGSDTGCVGAFCVTCGTWVGPHRDTSEEAEDDVQRHKDAVQRQFLEKKAHAATVQLDQAELRIVNGLLEEDPEDEPDFGPYFAHCADCGGPVTLGRLREAEASAEAEQHRAAFAKISATDADRQ